MDLGGSGNAQGPENEGPAGKEVEQEVAVKLKAPEGLMLDPGESLLVGSDRAVRVESEGKGENVASVTLKKKKDGLSKRVSVSAALVSLLAVTGWMAYKKVLASLLKPPLPSVPGVDEQIVFYSIKLFEARDALDEAWTAASDRVKKAFVANYMPSSDREQAPVSQALAFYKLQVLAMSHLGAPSRNEEIYVKKQHLYKQLLLFSILDAAVRRLEGLRHMEEDTELPALILDRGTRRAQDPKGEVAVGLFLEILKERGVDYVPSVALSEGEQGVTWARVNEFLDLLEMEEKFVSFDKKAREAFEVLLEGHGFSLKTLQPQDIAKIEEIKLPRDTQTVDARTFVQFLHSRYNARDTEDYRNKLLDEVVLGWSEQKVADAIDAFTKNHKKSLADQVRQKRLMLAQAREEPPPIPLTHGYPLAVFLV